ncbi:MAG: hypothetical protein RJA10_3457 [Pseudomonadota bacterium]|jgi:hypothetical protein
MTHLTMTRWATLSALAAALLLPAAGRAESNLQTGTGPLTATARLDFRITVPKVLFLQVGTGASLANNATINLIDFTVNAANLGDGTAVSASSTSGDLGNGTVTARLLGNNGNVNLQSATVGALGNGAGDSISFSQIATAVAPLTSATPLAHPALADGATTSTSIPATGKIVNRDARWTFTFLNAAAVPPGTYGGANANNGRVTYTASMP